jgi:membrane-bound lytic murein transglycosylase D
MRTLFIFIISLISFADVYSQDEIEKKLRLLEQKGLPYFYNNDIKQNAESWLKNENRVTSIIAGKQSYYSAKLEIAQRTNGLPWFIKYLPAANTGIQPNFVDMDGSSGIWPLNFSMGKKYGLRQNSLLDERRNVDLSSDAACKYIKDLYTIYRDWPKVITAFKIGGVRLNQVIRLANNSLNFADIYEKLTPEERAPIVQFYAAITVLSYQAEFGITPDEMYSVLSDTVSTVVSLPFSYIQSKTGIGIDHLKQLNPEFKSEIVPYFGTITYFKIPSDKKVVYNRVRDSFRIWLVETTKPPILYDTIVKVVDSVTYIEIKPKADEKKPPGPERSPVVVSPPPAPKPAAPVKLWVWYKVKPGDGFYTLSDVFDCTIPELKAWNGVRNNALIAGTTFKFYVPSAKQSYYQQINYMTQVQKRNLALKD